MPDILVIGYAFGFGLLAASPIGPVNMVAIRRGLIVHWLRTLWVGIGSVMFETCEVSLALWGGKELLDRYSISITSIRRYIGFPGAIVIIIIGILVFRKAFVKQHRIHEEVNAEKERYRQKGPAGDLLTGAFLTAINPATFLYWVLGVGPVWLQMARIPPGGSGIWFGVAAASCGMACWFIFITLLVRLRPKRAGAAFFRLANGICGVLLMIVGIYLAISALVVKS